MNGLLRRALLATLILLLTGCGSLMHHQVQKGETLYSISWRYSKDVKQLAAWNSLATPYVIHQGQMLRISPPPNATTSVLQPSVQNQQRRAAAVRASKATTTQAATVIPFKDNIGSISWGWPAQGKLLHTFAAKKMDRKGIKIGGAVGSPVRAAASGRVVYSGSGLSHYGNLLIIKHDESYLSAYAHNNKLLVKEGESVSRGQKIAAMGATGSDKVMLHFEIRRNGKPVDPQRYLPRR